MNRLEAFIWLLLRDHLTTGTVTEIIKSMGTTVIFNPDNPALQSLVEDYTKRILIP